MARAYLDSNVVIRLVEGQPGPRASLATFLAAHLGSSPDYVVSDLVRLECGVKPIAEGDAALLAVYERYFASVDMTVVGLSSAVCDRAAHIRAHYRYGTPDALHLAAAVEAGCEAFVTADARLASFAEMPVILVSPA